MFAIPARWCENKKIWCAYGVAGKENYDIFMALCDRFELTEIRYADYFEVKSEPHWLIHVSMPSDDVRDRFNSAIKSRDIAIYLSVLERRE